MLNWIIHSALLAKSRRRQSIIGARTSPAVTLSCMNLLTFASTDKTVVVVGGAVLGHPPAAFVLQIQDVKIAQTFFLGGGLQRVGVAE